MTKTFCDSCGKEGLVNHVRLIWGLDPEIRSFACQIENSHDLCDQCRDRVRKAVKESLTQPDART